MKQDRAARDSRLGLDVPIQRRDFLNGMLVAAGTAALGVAPRAWSEARGTVRERWGGNSSSVVAAGHRLRDGGFDGAIATARETGEAFDLVVVGGGFSGIAAALCYRQRVPDARVLVLECHDEPGGAARMEEFLVGGQVLHAPQGSIVHQELPPALAPAEPDAGALAELGIELAAAQVPLPALMPSVFTPEGGWAKNVFESSIAPEAKRDLQAFYEEAGGFYGNSAWQEALERLDRLSFREHCREKGWVPAMFEAMRPELAGFFGFPDQVSAAAVYRQYAGGPRPLFYFDGGNAAIFRRMLEKLIPGATAAARRPSALDRRSLPVRVRLDALAVRVEETGSDSVRVTYARNDALHAVVARHAVMACGGWVTRRIVPGLPPSQEAALGSFCYAPVVLINVALTNCRAVDQVPLGFISWIHGGYAAMLLHYEKAKAHDGPRDPERPVVLGLAFTPLRPGLPAPEQATLARQEILATPFEDYERAARSELVRLFGSFGFDPRRDVAAVSVCRWGHHGYIFPQPGFLSGSERRIGAGRCGRIAVAHTDLDGFSHMMGAIAHGRRAVRDLLDGAG